MGRRLLVVCAAAALIAPSGCSKDRTVAGRTSSVGRAIAGDALAPSLVLARTTDAPSGAIATELRARVAANAFAVGLLAPDGRELALETDAAGFVLRRVDPESEYPLGVYVFEAHAADGARKSASVHLDGPWPATPTLDAPLPGATVSRTAFEVRFAAVEAPAFDLLVTDALDGHLLHEAAMAVGTTSHQVPAESLRAGHDVQIRLRAATAPATSPSRLETSLVAVVSVGE